MVTSATRPSTATSIGASLDAAIRQTAEMQPEAPAMVSSEFTSLSYGDLFRQLDEVRTALQAHGLGRNAPIAISFPGVPRAAPGIVAVACSATAVPLDPNLTPHEVEKRLVLLDAAAVLAKAGTGTPAREVDRKLGIPILSATLAGQRDLRFTVDGARVAADQRPDGPDPADIAFILLGDDGVTESHPVSTQQHAGRRRAGRAMVRARRRPPLPERQPCLLWA